jgi:hypothetical protein
MSAVVAQAVAAAPSATSEPLSASEPGQAASSTSPGAIAVPVPAVVAENDLSSDRSDEYASQTDAGMRLAVPYRSQFDGPTFEWGNCGVSAISMAMEYYGHSVTTHDVRVAINQLTGNWDTHIGVDWRYLRIALERHGFSTEGPYSARGGYLTWTLEDVLAHVEQGHPVMLLLHYRSPPGHEEDEWIGDHYILILGQTGNGEIVYHDPGFPGDQGANMTIDRAHLEHAWSNTWIGQNRTAMVILPADGE